MKVILILFCFLSIGFSNEPKQKKDKIIIPKELILKSPDNKNVNIGNSGVTLGGNKVLIANNSIKNKALSSEVKNQKNPVGNTGIVAKGVKVVIENMPIKNKINNKTKKSVVVSGSELKQGANVKSITSSSYGIVLKKKLETKRKIKQKSSISKSLIKNNKDETKSNISKSIKLSK